MPSVREARAIHNRVHSPADRTYPAPVINLCRFRLEAAADHPALRDARWGVREADGGVAELTAAEVPSLGELLRSADPNARVRDALRAPRPRHAPGTVVLLPPVDEQEVWAAGVTYLRSKAARMEESEFSASAYDRVYDAPRPELFFKALPSKVVGPGDAVGVRRDSRWTVPEPELALVINPAGQVAGYTIGNDLSARDIEGENLLYLPQAKTYERSCALGPWIVLGADEATARGWTIGVRIRRDGAEVFRGQTEVGRIKRRFAELAEWLFRSQSFPSGAVLLTGTGVVPPDGFSLQPGDEVEIEVSGIGRLTNRVVPV